jgi:hypothetical protein
VSHETYLSAPEEASHLFHAAGRFDTVDMDTANEFEGSWRQNKDSPHLTGPLRRIACKPVTSVECNRDKFEHFLNATRASSPTK